MSKNRNEFQTKALSESPGVNATWSPPLKPVDETGAAIEEWKKCPLCWTGNGGYGLVQSTRGVTRYVACKKALNPATGPCGHSWTAKVLLKTIVIEHRVVTLDGER